MDEVLKDQNPMCGEMNFLLRVGKSKINMFKDCKSYLFFLMTDLRDLHLWFMSWWLEIRFSKEWSLYLMSRMENENIGLKTES